jgi:hypothetical protein
MYRRVVFASLVFLVALPLLAEKANAPEQVIVVPDPVRVDVPDSARASQRRPGKIVSNCDGFMYDPRYFCPDEDIGDGSGGTEATACYQSACMDCLTRKESPTIKVCTRVAWNKRCSCTDNPCTLRGGTCYYTVPATNEP